MSQIENPIDSAQLSSGQFAGIRLRFLPFTTTYISLKLNLNYRYTKTDNNKLNQNSEFIWHQTFFNAEVELNPKSKVSLILLAEYQDITGEQRNSGNIDQTTPFSELEQHGYQLKLNYKPYRNADIGIASFSGYSRGAGIYFIRRF